MSRLFRDERVSWYQLPLWARLRVALLAAAAVCAAGCASSDLKGDKSKHISKADYGEEWPFTVSDGILTCDGPGRLTFETGGTTYAANTLAAEYARTEALPWKNIEKIWADDGSGLGTKKNIGDVIADGLALCDDE